ncbi:hypothetical protein [Xinfangfangia pollutisoli]|uniref:hypothetical protein n=1 Tax=Xinfangfangia pollutisoli TaxID=2865960 RepID=UPI001CD4A893|nr:hypothetical protein [Xinfangfangia pollutisoli]
MLMTTAFAPNAEDFADPWFDLSGRLAALAGPEDDETPEDLDEDEAEEVEDGEDEDPEEDEDETEDDDFEDQDEDDAVEQA